MNKPSDEFQFHAVIDRYLLFILPLALIVLPLLGRGSLLYQAYMRNKINRWCDYSPRLKPGASTATTDESVLRLDSPLARMFKAAL